AYASAVNILASIHAPASPSSGCGSTLPSDLIPGAASINITLDSPLSSPNATLQKRQYRIHLPANYAASNDVAHPLLLTFNGQFQPTSSIENYTQFSLPSINPNAIAVYPEGIGNQFLGDPTTPNSSYINDVQFVSDVLDDLESKLCVDTNRIYATGLSNGGSMTGLLFCNGTVGGRFAALAGVAPAYYSDDKLTEPLYGAGCGKDRDGLIIPYMEIHGDVDKVVAYGGDNSPQANTLPVPVYLAKIAELNGCEDDAKGILNGGNVTRYAWTCNDLEDVVVHYKVKGL
ncbi:uncharacterized protein MYCFIDRAFT_120730, partial [Pseudocercospora fijiensis CIRAD86]